MPKQPAALICDFDDTLVGTGYREKVWADTLEVFGIDKGITDARRLQGLAFRDLLPLDEDAYLRFLGLYADQLATLRPRPASGALELLTSLWGRAVPVVVLTASHTRIVQTELQTSGLIDYVSVTYGADQTRFHKPDPRVLLEVEAWLAMRSIALDECLYVGDAVSDYLAARSKCPFAGVLSGSAQIGDFLRVGCPTDLLYPTLHEVLNALAPA